MSGPRPTLHPSHSPALIASTEKVRAPRISPDGRQVVHEVQPMYRVGDRATCALWIADTTAEDSACQLTSGDWYDRAVAWHPDGNRIFFLSDRNGDGNQKRSTSVWTMSTKEGGTVGRVLQEGEHVGGAVSAFEISPNGLMVAFTSAGVARGALAEKDDALVYGEKSRLSRLRVCELNSGDVRTLSIKGDKHVESFSWSFDSRNLLYRLRDNAGVESTAWEVLLESVSVIEGDEPISIGTYASSPSGPTLGTSTGHILDLQSYDPETLLDARTLFVHPPATGFTSRTGAGEGDIRHYGKTEDAVRLVQLGGDQNKSYVAVEVSTGIDTRVDVVCVPVKGSHNDIQIETVFHTQDDAIWFGAWDIVRVVHPQGGQEFVFAGVISSGARHQPPNLYVCRYGPTCRHQEDSSAERDKKDDKALKLSKHLQWLADAPRISAKVLQWKTRDGAHLNGLVRYPPNYESSWGPLPTIMVIHGGPYRRDIPDYMPYYCNWREMLASAGYLVISPNYRGGQGRGHNFACAANEGVGALDWPDCESMLDETIKLGLSDAERVGVAGWSHGGSLTAWGVTHTKTRFKAAVVGAGVSSWEGVVMESASPELEAAISGRAPWHPTASSGNSPCAGYGYHRTSPIHNLHGVTTAVLILHGEKDERVPVGQAIGLYRGLKRAAAQQARERVQLVLYPREPHGFVERDHARDVMERVLKHLFAYL